MADLANSGPCHVVAIPYPGRGHINPLMNLCKILAQRRPSDFVITFIVTEEWLGFIGSEPKPDNIWFATIPNVLPSELGRAKDFLGFINAVQTKMEHPVEQLLHRMEVPANVLIYDTYLIWVLNLGKRMGIPIASVFTMSASVFSMTYHYDLLVKNGHVGDDFSEKIDEEVDYIPGVLPIRVADLVTGFNGRGKQVTPVAVKAAASMAPKAQFLLFVSIYELEAKVIDFFESELSIPVYAIGPGIPYINLNDVQSDQCTPDYIKWLDGQLEASVLYISQGSFLSVSNDQLEEIIAGVCDSNVRYLWVACGETSRFKNENKEKGLVIPWCDQLKVLCHGSIGGFWSHCGWNSTKEGAFAGVPMLTCPIFWDQTPNSKMIVEDWKMGKRVKIEEDSLLTREELAKLIKSFMGRESEEGKEMRKRAKEVQKICQQAIAEGGSAQTDIDSFISDILRNHKR